MAILEWSALQETAASVETRRQRFRQLCFAFVWSPGLLLACFTNEEEQELSSYTLYTASNQTCCQTQKQLFDNGECALALSAGYKCTIECVCALC